jgi:hypothetical protein
MRVGKRKVNTKVANKTSGKYKKGGMSKHKSGGKKK